MFHLSFSNKIVIVDDARTYGGAQIAMVNAVKVLSRAGCRNLVVLYSEKNSQLSHLLKSIDGVELVPCLRSRPFNILLFFASLPYFLLTLFRGRIWLAQAVVFNLSGIEFCLAPAVAARILGAPIIGWLHLTDRLEALIAPKSRVKSLMYFFRDRFAEFWVLGLYRKFLVPSMASAKILLARSWLHDLKVVPLYNVYDPGFDFFETRPIDLSLRVLSIAVVGRVDFRHKGQDVLVDVCKLLAENGINVVFKVIGSGVDLDSLKSDSIKNGVSDKFIFLGWREDVLDILRDVDILFIPSRFEGLPLVACEGIYAGCRVVSSPLPCFHEVLPVECIATDHSAAAYCAKILQIAGANERLLTDQYRSKVQKFSKSEFISSFNGVVLDD